MIFAELDLTLLAKLIVVDLLIKEDIQNFIFRTKHYLVGTKKNFCHIIFPDGPHNWIILTLVAVAIEDAILAVDCIEVA